jgi:phage terminase large subunit-like protein
MSFGLRIGDHVQGVFTSTPKPTKFIKSVLSHPRTVVTHGSTYENRANLAPGFFADILRKYEGTRLGRQEIEAELLEDLPGALWTRAMIDNHRIMLEKVPTLFRVVVAIDPAVTAGEDSNETGIVVVGLDHARHCYVLEDATCKESPGNWARIACQLFLKWNADRIIGEVNQGGDMVGHAIHTIHHGVPYRSVRATRGKAKRAEPAAALYEQGRVHHVGAFAKMEDQLCGFVPGLEEEQDSPDRMDALVWALTDLVIDPEDQYIVHSSPSRVISPI